MKQKPVTICNDDTTRNVPHMTIMPSRDIMPKRTFHADCCNHIMIPIKTIIDP